MNEEHEAVAGRVRRLDDNLGRREFCYLAGGRSIGLWGITVNLVW